MCEENKVPAIEVIGLTKNYQLKKALNDVSFKVNKGEIMGLLGPNGAGKSTTMNIITGYISASKGRVIVDGVDCVDDPVGVKRKIGYLPEIPPLYEDMTVWEYLSFVYELKNAAEEKNKHLEKIMDMVKISDVKGRLIKNLSKGYKQRVGFAQALIGDPDILILDEPTAGLDPSQIIEIREVISNLGKEKTVILSTHIMQEVMAVCDRYTIINKGKIALSGDISEFDTKYSQKYRLRVKTDEKTAVDILNTLHEVSAIDVIGSLEDSTIDLIVNICDDTDAREQIFTAFANRSIPILLFETQTQTLEQIFMGVIENDVEFVESKEEVCE